MKTSDRSMKSLLKRISLFAIILCALCVTAKAQTTTNVFLDPSRAWNGYMGVSELNGTYLWGSGWGIPDLCAGFTGDVLTLSPNHINDPAAYWYTPSGGPGAVGNKLMSASFYVEDASLASVGTEVVFSGYCWSDTLVPTNDHCTVFIKEFDSFWNVVGSSTLDISAPGPFSITNVSFGATTVQYGFTLNGPCWWVTDVGSKGSIIFSSNPPPAGPVITAVSPASPIYVNATSNLTIAATVTGGNGALSYQWKRNGLNVTDGPGISGATTASLTLSNVTGAAEAGYSLVVKDSLNNSATNYASVVVFYPENLSFDPNANLMGYINIFDTTPAHAYVNGQAFGTAALRASLTNGVVTLQPNTNLWNPDDPTQYWTLADGTPNKWIEQDYYIQNDGLAGRVVTFAGFCPSNSLAASYQATAFIKDLAANWSSQTIISTNLVAGQPFSITYPTVAGDHVQYGFAVFGDVNSPTNPITQGAAVITISPPTVSVARVGNATSLSFPTMTGHDYTVQYKSVLVGGTWQSLSKISGTGEIMTVPVSNSPDQNFYRVYVQ